MLEVLNLDSSQQYPIEVSMMMKIFFICALQYGSQKPYVSIKHSKYDSCN